jgi:hypothetical protein
MSPRPKWLLLLGLLLLPLCAQAKTRICLQIKAPATQMKNFDKLVRAELAHHPTHEVVADKCQSLLVIEIFEMKKTWFLTARVNQEVPVRHSFKEMDDLEHKLKDAISQVLSHDPVYLADDITHYSSIQRAANSILKRGNNFWRLELFQGIGRGGSPVSYAPGAAVSITRGADNWQVFVRVFFAGWPGSPRNDDTVLAVNTGADVGLTYEFSALSSSSFYVSLGVGLQYQRYSGLLDPDDPGSVDYRNDFGPTLSARAGFRFLRIYNFDCDIFIQGYLPLYPADVDSMIGKFYPLTLQAGFGVGF